MEDDDGDLMAVRAGEQPPHRNGKEVGSGCVPGFYASLEECGREGGRACLNSWATKTGEVGPFVRTAYC